MGKNLNNESELEINKGLAIRNQHFDVYDLIEVHNAYRMAFLQECAEADIINDYNIAYVAPDVTEKMAEDIIRNIDKYDYSVGDAIKKVSYDYYINGKIKCSDNYNKEDKLCAKGMDIKGLHLTYYEMECMNAFYEVTSTQEYIYENMNLSVKKALNIATAVRKKMKEDLFLNETEAIKSVRNSIRSNSR